MFVACAGSCAVRVIDWLGTRRGRWVAFASLTGALLFWRRAEAKRDLTVRGPKWEPERYGPGSRAMVELFEAAAEVADVPLEWASSPELEELLRRESDGWVGIPNYQYGELSFDKRRWPEVWAKIRRGECPERVEGVSGKFTCATGMGQLIPSNVDRYYPDGRMGIGDPLNEAVGMLAYLDDRYQNPKVALAFWDAHGWY